MSQLPSIQQPLFSTIHANNRQVEEGGSPTTLSQRIYDVAMAPFRGMYAIYDFVRPENPLTKERQVRIFPEWLECAIGRYMYRGEIERFGGEWENSRCKRMVDTSVKNMIPHTGRPNLAWKMTMIDCGITNAWSMFGGYMGINRALIDKMLKENNNFGLGYISDEDKIAAVTAHEMAHIGARHSARHVEFSIFWLALVSPLVQVVENVIFFLPALVFSAHSRSFEYEADKYGMEMMLKAGYDPKAAIWVQCFFKNLEATFGISWMDWIDRWFWGHPDADYRIEANKLTLAELQKRP